jgi:hypothetical protein
MRPGGCHAGVDGCARRVSWEYEPELQVIRFAIHPIPKGHLPNGWADTGLGL